jgi:hypothetical protein
MGVEFDPTSKKLGSSLVFLFSWCYCGPNNRCPSSEAFVFLTIHAKFGNPPLQISQISPPFLHICNISIVGNCAAEAIFYGPTMNSHRPKSQNTSKEQALIPEKETRRTWPRCHVSLEKSSKKP